MPANFSCRAFVLVKNEARITGPPLMIRHSTIAAKVLIIAALWVDAAVANEPSPNIIVIFSDDQGFADLSSQGVRNDIQTPHIDRLVRSGVRMTHGFVTAPQCMPSRTGLLTGRYQQHSGVESNLMWTQPNNANQMLPGVHTIATALKQAGYTTGMSGKWGVGGSLSRRDMQTAEPSIRDASRKLLPAARGFDEYFCGTLNPYIASHDLNGKKLTDAPQIIRDTRYRVEVQADAAVNFIDRHASDAKPFFLYFAPYSPHSPFDAPASYITKFSHIEDPKRRTCVAMMSCVDDCVGRIMDTLQQRGITQNTMVWYISDNGAPKNGGGFNEPLSGWKGNLLDGGIRVPFSVSWPSRIDSGMDFDPMASTLDVLPTCLAAAGIEQLAAPLDGVNLLPFLDGTETQMPHEELFFRWTFGANSQFAIRTAQWKGLQGGGQFTLFDLKNNPRESIDVSSENPAIAADLQQRLRKWGSTLPAVAEQPNRKRSRGKNR